MPPQNAEVQQRLRPGYSARGYTQTSGDGARYTRSMPVFRLDDRSVFRRVYLAEDGPQGGIPRP